MRSSAIANRPKPRPRRRAAAAAVICIALVAAYVTTATAKPESAQPLAGLHAPDGQAGVMGDSHGQGPGDGHGNGPGDTQGQGRGNGGGGGQGLGSGDGHGQGQGNGGGQGNGHGDGQGNPQGQGSGQGGGNGNGNGGGFGGGNGTSTSTGTGRGSDQGQGHGESTQSGASSTSPTHEASGLAPVTVQPAPITITPTPVLTSPVTVGVTPTPVSTPTPATPTVVPTPQPTPVSSGRPVGGERSHQSGPNRRSAASRGVSNRAGAIKPFAPAFAATGLPASRLLAAVTSSARAPAPARRPPARTHRPPVSNSPLPLVPTITRIIGVVPVPIRILIAALAALALALAANSRLAARRARRLAGQREELLADVGLLQAALLPVPAGRLGPVGTSAAYLPADGPAAGGDFYDLFGLEDGTLAVIVGDLSGHGRRALPHTALVRFTLRAYLEAGLPPRDALQTAAGVLERQLGDSFATVVVATYHPRDRLLVYASAGHPPPIVLGSRAIAPITICSSPPIGTGQPTGTRQTTVSLPGRSMACFYTDGLIEARVGGELFGAARLERALDDLGPDASASALLDRVAATSDQRPDDMAACLLQVEGDLNAPAILGEELELDRSAAASDRPERFLRACGVDPAQVQTLMRSARAAAERDGTVVLQVDLGQNEPRVRIAHHNVAPLHGSAHRTANAS